MKHPELAQQGKKLLPELAQQGKNCFLSYLSKTKWFYELAQQDKMVS